MFVSSSTAIFPLRAAVINFNYVPIARKYASEHDFSEISGGEEDSNSVPDRCLRSGNEKNWSSEAIFVDSYVILLNYVS